VILEITGDLTKTRQVMRENGAVFPVLLDDICFSRESLHIMGTPTMLVIDEEGTIRSRLVGRMENLTEIVKNIILRI
jgi:hypothetical protein